MTTLNYESAVSEFAQSMGLLVRRVRAASASEELSWTETSVLVRLAKEGPATTAELARAQGMRPQSMRSVLATLENLGMVKRRPHPSDGRQVNLVLTARGASVGKSTTDAKRTWLAQAIARLDAGERQTLFAAGDIMKRIARAGSQ